jgi:hypothetical protein
MKKLSLEEFIIKANIIHNNKYDYSKSIYTSSKDNIIIICNVHGKFIQTPNNHLQGEGCNKCSGREVYNTKDFIEKANIIHNNYYNYNKVNYIRSIKKVVIICSKHGEFKQTPNDHLSGYGCNKCAILTVAKKNTISTEEFISRAKIIHNNLYDYSKTICKKQKIKVIVTCSAHGDFTITPNNHLRGKGCPICVHTISKSEIEWLNKLNVPIEFRHKTLKINGKNYMVDAYNPRSNTIYEFYGDYWHGNPKIYKPYDFNIVNKKKFGILFEKTMYRENILKNAGYNVVSVWESDFKAVK